MQTSLIVQSQVVADASITRVSLRRILGAYELVLLIDVTPKPLRERVWWFRPQSVRVKVIGSPDCELGIARPDRTQTVRQTSTAYSEQVWTMLPLNPHQLSAIEDSRDARDLTLGLTIHGDGGDGENVRAGFQADGRLVVPKSQWVEQLNAVGAADILLLEIPMPLDALGGARAKAAKQVRQAQAHIIAGNYAEAVGACRVALEELDVKAHPLNLFHGPGRDSMTKIERGQAMLAAIRHYTHPPHHAGAETYSRQDAKLALQVTAAAVATGAL